MKIMQINCVYNKGSTGKIMCDIHSYLISKGIDSVICYGRGKETTDPNVYKTCGEAYSKLNNLLSRFTGLMYGGCLLSTKKLISVIKREKPDIIHVHCINGYFVNVYDLIDWLKKSDIPTVITLHAEFMHTANCAHAYDCEGWKTGCGNCPRFKIETKSLFLDNTALSWKKMKAAFEGFSNLVVVSVSPWLRDRAQQSPILGEFEHRVVLNGLNTDVFKVGSRNIYREKHGITNEKIVFHATPQFDDNPEGLKGGYHIIKLAEKMKNENVKIFVAGNYPQNIKVPENIVLLGIVADQATLADYYTSADVTVLTSKRETFSMVVAESLCCGTPVAGFCAGAPEQITISEFSRFSEYGNVDLLKENVLALLNRDFDKTEIRNVAKNKYDKEKMITEYMKIYFGMKEAREING